MKFRINDRVATYQCYEGPPPYSQRVEGLVVAVNKNMVQVRFKDPVDLWFHEKACRLIKSKKGVFGIAMQDFKKGDVVFQDLETGNFRKAR